MSSTPPTHDLVIRGGRVVDGSGRPPFEADVAITGRQIVAVGRVEGRGRRELDATGKIVTPGFVDVHSHYDGQATWESRMAPSSGHGVSTVVMGNCGVGFAPCRPQDRETLVAILEGVEDIPEVVMSQGLPWNWETFPEYLDALGQRQYDVDLVAQLPHSPLRVYVMGQRGIDREPSTDDDRRRMRELTREAIEAGAFGVSTSRSHFHQRVNGQLIPSIHSEEEELVQLGLGLKDAGAGVYQLLPDGPEHTPDELDVLVRVARACGRPMSFSLNQSMTLPENLPVLLGKLDAARREGLEVRGVFIPRPIGVLFGLDLSLNPFSLKPAFKALESLPLAQKLAALRDPQMRQRLLSESPDDPNTMRIRLCGNVEEMYVLGDPPQYFPKAEDSLGARAARQGVSAAELAYDLLTAGDGRTLLYKPLTNFADKTASGVLEMMRHDGTVMGLADGGAHYGLICDAGFPTFVLTDWVRDGIQGTRFDLAWAIKALTHDAATMVGLSDRGLLAPGYKADVNIIDLAALRIGAPQVVRDLPAGGRRLTQTAQGYVATIVSGVVTYEQGAHTGALPGRLVRSSEMRATAGAE